MLAERVSGAVLSTAWQRGGLTKGGERSPGHGGADGPPPATSPNLRTPPRPRVPSRDNATVCSALHRTAAGIARDRHRGP